MCAPIVLASTSVYRRQLLERLRLPFRTAAPRIDETALPGEAPPAIARRLALLKAQAIAQAHPGAIVIGSDQVADLGGAPVGKPLAHGPALQQLAWDAQGDTGSGQRHIGRDVDRKGHGGLATEGRQGMEHLGALKLDRWNLRLGRASEHQSEPRDRGHPGEVEPGRRPDRG
jgi:hypothetical protein